MPTSTPALSSPRPRLAGIFVAVSLAFFASACGPGIGGTGTGSPAASLPDFGATAANVCSAPFAAQIGCPAPATVTPGPVAPPSPAPSPAPSPSPGPSSPQARPAFFADVVTGRSLSAVFDGNQITLDARCEQLSFVGTWGVTAAGEARYFGSVTNAATGSVQPATLRVDVVPGQSAALQVLLQGRDAPLPLGATVLVPVATVPPPPDRCL